MTIVTTAFRALHADLFQVRLRVFALRESRAGKEFAVRAILNHHVASALVADHIRHLVSDLDALQRPLRLFHRLCQDPDKSFSTTVFQRDQCPSPMLSSRYSRFAVNCKSTMLGNALLHDPVDYLAKLRHIEVLIFLRHIAARDDCRDRRCIGTWTSDALLLQRLDQGRLCVMCRRLCKMLCRL